MTESFEQSSRADQPLDTRAHQPPRAFARGTGVVLQVVGMTLFLATCCVCSGMGVIEAGLTPDQAMQGLDGYQLTERGVDEWTQDPSRAGLMATIVFMTLGGLAMAILGLGMQSDKPRAAGGALITTAALTVVLLLAAVGLWTDQASLMARLSNALGVVVALVMTGFCLTAWREVRADPPSGELNTVPPDFEPRAYGYGTGQPLTPEQVEQMRQRLESIERHLEHHRRRQADQSDSR